MQDKKQFFKLSPIHWVIILGAALKFAMHQYTAPGYGFFSDELYTLALSRHLAFGYVDLPPLTPALLALSRSLLGESLFALHIVPALAGAGTLVFVCLMAKAFGGKVFAVVLSALGFIAVPLWLGVDSIFCYDSIDQFVLAGFLYTLVRFLKSGNRRLWILLGLAAGIACMTKITILFLGPGFLVGLLLSKYRRDLLTPWPWIGAVVFGVVVSPYLFWQFSNHWPSLEYWTSYGTARVYQASIPQYFMNILFFMNSFLLPLWIGGLYRIFRRLDGINYRFLGYLFLVTLVLMFMMHASARMLAELFMPLLAASAVLFEELLARIRWKKAGMTITAAYLLVVIVITIPSTLPILPLDVVSSLMGAIRLYYPSMREFNGSSSYYPPMLSGRLGWDELVRDVAGVYNELPTEDRKIAGIFADWYMSAGAIDQLGPAYGLPHAVSGSLTYYLWGPGYSWDVMIIVSNKTNILDTFFEECELKATVEHEFDSPVGRPYIHVCKKPKISAEKIWKSQKSYR